MHLMQMCKSQRNVEQRYQVELHTLMRQSQFADARNSSRHRYPTVSPLLFCFRSLCLEFCCPFPIRSSYPYLYSPSSSLPSITDMIALSPAPDPKSRHANLVMRSHTLSVSLPRIARVVCILSYFVSDSCTFRIPVDTIFVSGQQTH